MFELITLVVLTTLGYVFGRAAERKHFASIFRREEQLKDLLVFNERQLPPGDWQRGQLVEGNVVISLDYFKRLVSTLKALFGGRLTAYESLLERARREALLRMKEHARAKGADMVINVRLETASISKGKGDQIGSVEVYAYGTALIS